MRKQVGGTHYSCMNYQPIDLIQKLNLDPFRANILKYYLREKDNKDQDLEKAKHYAEMLVEAEKKGLMKKYNKIRVDDKMEVICFMSSNKLTIKQSDFLVDLCEKKNLFEMIMFRLTHKKSFELYLAQKILNSL